MLTYAQKSDQGRIRELNEDAMLIVDPGNEKLGALFVVADGLGGMPHGELASDRAVNEMQRIFSAQNEFVDASFLRDWIQAVNTKIYNVNKYLDPNDRMATTLTCAHFYKKMLIIGHVGDSRAYQIRDGKLKQLTTDHAKSRNELTRVVGVEHTVGIDLYQIPIEIGDYYIQCTDGLYAAVSERDIVDAVLYHSLSVACDKLIVKANENGGQDNSTIQIIQIEKDP